MVHLDWDSAPSCVCGPNFVSDLFGESPIFPAARFAAQEWRIRTVTEQACSKM